MRFAKMYGCLFVVALFVAMLCAPRISRAQYRVKGTLQDSAVGPLSNAVVAALRAKDSLMVKFTRSDSQGNFMLDLKDTGRYVFLMTYPNYGDLVLEQNIDQPSYDFGMRYMLTKAKILEDVIVKQTVSAIKIKGDTTEFIADSFKVQPNATVEDLLKKLPGIQVDKNGKITAQGQTVPKVLVDGEEFFGDDPTLVTKNLRADMVDKVQLFDKSTDQAAFTGIDDGNKTKTINIKLKEDKKNGYFGKLSGGLATDKFRETQDMFNYFKGKRKFAGYVTFSNLGKTGLGFEDEMKYGSSGNITTDVSDGGDVMFFISGGGNDPLSSWNGSYNGSGLPDAKTGGVHFDTKWNEDKQDVNLNYKIGGLNVRGIDSTVTQNNTDDHVYYTRSNHRFNNDIFRQKFDGIYNLQLDSSSSLKFTLGGSVAHATTDDYTESLTNKDGVLLNTATNASNNKSDTKALNASALWRKKFKKKGRTLSTNFNLFVQDKNGMGFINNHNYFYNTGSAEPDSSYLVDQRKTSDSKSTSLNANIAYTEPLSKYVSLVVSYGLGMENATSDIRSFNQDADGDYTELDRTYSNHYVYNQLTNTGGLAMNYKKGRMNFNLGTDVGTTNYHQVDTFTSVPLDRNFMTWMSKASFRYKFSQQSSLRFNYNGRTQQPSVTQIQPVLNNNDNLNVYVGNPYLKPSYNNNLNFGINNYKVLSSQSIGVYGGYSFVVNPIVTDVTTNDTTGGNRYTYFNIHSSTSNYYLSAYFSRKWKLLDLSYNINLNLNGSKYVNFINQVMNTTKSNTYRLGAYLGKYKEGKIDLSLDASVGYTKNNSTLQNQIDNNYWSYELQPNFDVFLPAKFQVHTDGDYNWQQKTQSFAARSQFIWNAWVGKKFFKKENLLLKVVANDLLNQNNGFKRSAYNNTYTQSVNMTIRRYFMFSVVWNFTKMAGGAEHPQ
ncbi:MAG: TonB-dependent receptor [Chitinophagaceae bacterium]